MPTFEMVPGAGPSPGMVLKVEREENRFLRITHAFETCVYALWVDEPEQARYSRRPLRMSRKEISALAAMPGSAWGRLELPAAMTNPPTHDSEAGQELQAAWSLIEPLTASFERESNLSRTMFTALIQQRANATDVSFTSLRRLLLRYYYFGRTRFGLLSLPPGAKPSSTAETKPSPRDDQQRSKPKRRGRQPILAKELGTNDFVVSDDDIADMVECLQSALRKGATFITNVHEDYLRTRFKKRHPKIYASYKEKKRPEPVTSRQFRYYVNAHTKLTADLAKNLRTFSRNQGRVGSIVATGPGEVYEIDATGGRIHLVTSEEPITLVGKPIIYVMVDRWSRFVVSAYISLRPASYEEVRQALLIAFTSRKRRFNRLGIDIDDERWPIGRMPAVLCEDRGSEMISESMIQSAVEDLRIEVTPLPPLCPDGKAIVERLIRELKRRMAASGLKGVYADRPLDPRSKRVAKKAEAAAIHTLVEAYRELIKIIEDHNNRPHSALKRIRALTQAGVAPTPKAAYLWGLKNITGLRAPPLTDKDYRRLLLSRDKASLASGVLKYKSRAYMPSNEPAIELAAKSSIRTKQVDIRLDRTDPIQILIPNSRSTWAEFTITRGAAQELARSSLDEEEAFAAHTALLWARAENESRIDRLTNRETKLQRNAPTSPATHKPARKDQADARARETDTVKKALSGNPRGSSTSRARPTKSTPEWARLEEAERLRNLELIRKKGKSR